MHQYFLKILITLAALAATGCGHPSMDVMFNTSTEAYPVTTDAEAAALANLAGDSTGISVTSVIRIQMQGIADAKMQSVKLDALVLVAKEGDIRFVQLAKCYVQPRTGSQGPVLVGSAKAENVSDDGKSLKFQVDSGQELSGILKSPFNIVVEIEGDNPTGKVSVSAELKLKARVTM